VYDPAAGTRLENGQHSVTCRFVPAMPHNFHAVELRRDFFVHRAVPKLCWNPPCAPMGSPFRSPHTVPALCAVCGVGMMFVSFFVSPNVCSVSYGPE
jgi:hypothetical protein